MWAIGQGGGGDEGGGFKGLEIPLISLPPFVVNPLLLSFSSPPSPFDLFYTFPIFFFDFHL